LEIIFEYIRIYHVGDLASIIGLLTALVGFAITIRNVSRSRDAASRAEEAAKSAVQSVKGIEAIEGLTNAMALLEEIARLNRAGEWKVILDRHEAFRKLIIEIKSEKNNMEEDYLSDLQSSFQHSRNMSNKIEVFIDERPTDKIGVPQMNKIISGQMEKLGEILVHVRSRVGGV